MNGRVLVLNASYEPINVCCERRAVVMIFKGVARVEEHNGVSLVNNEGDDMNEDPTRELPGATPFEQRVLSALAELNARYASLEERVERRLTETRPIWEAVLAEQKRTNAKLDNVITDLYNLRADVTLIATRVAQLEHART